MLVFDTQVVHFLAAPMAQSGAALDKIDIVRGTTPLGSGFFNRPAILDYRGRREVALGNRLCPHHGVVIANWYQYHQYGKRMRSGHSLLQAQQWLRNVPHNLFHLKIQNGVARVAGANSPCPCFYQDFLM